MAVNTSTAMTTSMPSQAPAKAMWTSRTLLRVWVPSRQDEIDLDALSAELLAVAHRTMQPTRATLWLRPSAQAGPPGQGHGS